MSTRDDSQAMLPRPDGASPTPPSPDVLADARAEARSWSPNTRRSYVAGWRDFTNWCLEHRCPGLPSVAADIGRYLEDLVETQGRTLATARLRLSAIAAAHRLGGHPDPTGRPPDQGHAETAGQRARQAQKTGQRTGQRSVGHGENPTNRQRQEAQEGN